MTKVLFLSGYSRAGKSSLIRHLNANYDYTYISTSDYLTLKTIEHLKLIPNLQIAIQENSPILAYWVDVFLNKKDAVLSSTNLEFADCRAAKIHVAENVIVPELGRKQGLVVPAIKLYGKNASHIICEVFNREELESGWLPACKDVYGHFDSKLIHIRRDGDLAGVDGRELLGQCFYNDSSVEELAWKVHNFLISK